MTTNIQKRNQNIDIIKGIAMCLVIWGHSLQYASNERLDFFELPVFRIIYSFHMPLFAAVSGYLLGMTLERRTFQENIHHRITTIFWVIITAHLLWFFFVSVPRFLFAFIEGNNSSIINNAKNMIVGKSLKVFWFLWTILVCSIATCIVFQKIKKPIVKLLMILFCQIFSRQFPCGTLIFNMFPFFIVGAFLGKNKIKCYIYQFNEGLKMIIIVLYICIFHFFQRRCYIYRPIYLTDISLKNNIIIYIIRLGCGFLGTLSIYIILKEIYYISVQLNFKFIKKMIRLCKKHIAFIGVNSLKFYVFQCIVFDGGWFSWLICKVSKFFPNFLKIYNNTIVYQFIFTPLITLSVIIVLYQIISKMNEKNYAEFLWKP